MSEDKEKPIIYLEFMSKDTLDVAKSHLNWMNFKGAFQDNDYNPFAFKHIKIINNIAEFKQELESGKPRVVLTSSSSLDTGFGKKIVTDFLEMESNMVIFTEQIT